MRTPTAPTGRRRPSIKNLAASPASGMSPRLLTPPKGVVLSLPPSVPQGARFVVSQSSTALSSQRTGRQGTVSLRVAILMTFIFVISIVTAWLVIRPKGRGSLRHGAPFCCPQEVRRLSRIINASVDPCTDFHLHTCFNRIRFNRTKKLKMRDVYEGDIIQGVGSSMNTTAGSALSGYYRSCLNGILNTDVLCGEMTTGILQTFNIREKMDINLIAKFCIIMFGLYGINGILHWVIQHEVTRIEVRYDAATALSKMRRGCLDHIVAAYNRGLKTSVDVNALLKFEKDGLPIPPATAKATETGVLINAIFSFFEIEWRNLARAVAIPTAFVTHPRKEYLIDLFRTIGDNQPLSTAYVVTSFVYNSYKKVTRDPSFARNMSGLEISGVCHEELNRANNLWEALYAQAATNPKRDSEFRAIFDQLINNVSTFAVASNIFKGDDTDIVKPTLERLRLLLPSDLAVPSLKVPNITDRRFGVNYFVVRRYETLMMKVKLEKTYVLNSTVGYFDAVLTRNNHLRLSAGYYRASQFSSNSSRFLSMPVLGVRMARVMWRYLLTYDGWSDETSANIRKFQNCFRRYIGGYRRRNSEETEDEAVVYVLAIKSVVSAMTSAPDWHTVKEAWKLIKMSKAQLFYLRYMDSMCHELGHNQSLTDPINVPLRYITDFATAFQCSAHTPMVASELLESCWTNGAL